MTVQTRMDAFAATLLIGFSALLGLNQALVKLVNAGLSPMFQGGLRSACAVGVIAAWMIYRGKAVAIPRDTLLLAAFNGLLFSLEFALLFVALDVGSVARVSLLFYTMPFYVALGAHFLLPGERLTTVRSVGLLVAVAGVALVMAGGPASHSGTNALLGDVLALGASLCWAALTLLTRVTRLARLTPEQNLLCHLVVSGIVLLAITPLFGSALREPTAVTWGIFAVQVFVITSIGFLVWLWVLAHYPVSNMASFSLLTPLFGVFFGWLVFDDVITARFMLAIVMVCGGLLLVNRRAGGR